MPELSPGALSFFATLSATALEDHRHHYRCPLNDDNNKDFAASSATKVTFPAIGASATSSTTSADRLAFFVCRLNDASSAAADRRNDSAKEPTADGQPSVFREALRGGAHGARLSVHILLYALPEFTDRQV